MAIRSGSAASSKLRGGAASGKKKGRVAVAATVLAITFSASLFYQSADIIDRTTGEFPSYFPELILREFLSSNNNNNNNMTSQNIILSNQLRDAEDYSEWLGCLTDDCIRRIANRLARAFPPRHDKSSWCHPAAQQRQPNKNVKFDGLLLTKVPKGASSTSAGVVLRLAHRHHCANAPHWQHRLAAEYAASRQQQTESSSGRNNNNTSSTRSFLLTTVRDPAQRALSTLFFHVVSRTPHQQAATSDVFLMQQLQTSNHSHYGAVAPATSGFQLRYAMLLEEDAATTATATTAWNPSDPERVQDPAKIAALVRHVLDSYDFILVPERMDESLVCLALTLQVDVGDVLVASSKVAGSNGSSFHLLHPKRDQFECVPTVRGFASAAVRAFLAGPRWRALNYGDYLLHAAANASLDRTIAQYNNNNNNGSNLFDAALARYRHLQTLERQRCPAPHFPCSAAGEPQIELAAQDCYLRHYDFGCGYPCIDALLLAEAAAQDGNSGEPAAAR